MLWTVYNTSQQYSSLAPTSPMTVAHIHSICFTLFFIVQYISSQNQLVKLVEKKKRNNKFMNLRQFYCVSHILLCLILECVLHPGVSFLFLGGIRGLNEEAKTTACISSMPQHSYWLVFFSLLVAMRDMSRR